MAAVAILILRLPHHSRNPRTRREENEHQREFVPQGRQTLSHRTVRLALLRKGRMLFLMQTKAHTSLVISLTPHVPSRRGEDPLKTC